MGGKGLDDIRDYFGGMTSCRVKRADKKIISSSDKIIAPDLPHGFPKGFFQGLRGGSKGGYEGCAGRVPKGFRRGFRRVSEGVSEGFPWVSGGFHDKVSREQLSQIIYFATS